MRFSALFPIGLGVAAAIAPALAWADTQYVTDRLEATLRTGESNRYKILKMLPSGTPLEVLSVNKTTEFARVRTADGTLGFVPAGQLQPEPAARDRLAEVEARLAELQQDPNGLAARLAALQSEYGELKARSREGERARQRLEQELATIRHASANVLDIVNDRERLRIQVADLTRARADLEQANRDLVNQTNQRWFLIGSGVLGGGLILGLILPRLRFGRRKSAWDSL